MAESRRNGEPERRDGQPADEPETQDSNGDTPDEFERFEDLARRLVQVPKSELDEKRKTA